ncbi:AraC-like DNA-binding protein [Aureibacter tunicatorum]|uniref:AraC-like DNA-binding protein n=2 Tax=Aureibacter tunicatorum TaxID=866807 RepID=A0AAE3XP86_9BACT|nr:AraC-like DNA-binding protein [Aureibacter tunicatorum]
MTSSKMKLYNKEVERIKKDNYSNQWQIDTVIGLRKYIQEHFEDELNLSLFSRISFVSKYHLLRLFKRYYGQTPKQYLIDMRIEKSKEYISQGMSVTEACYAVGFESIGSFSTLFKKKTGSAPTEFQKRAIFKK